VTHEFSAGVVIFFQTEREPEYLLLHYTSGHWDFPKGHIEKGESKQQAALREVTEETGLQHIELLPDFQTEFSYIFRSPSTGELIKKTVYFFIGKSNEKEIKLSHEHIGFAWSPFKTAIAQLTYQNAKDLLVQADHYLTKKASV
jgi:8-oxo-dGTP pyrophosphatase MutT (NUDIX family)